MFYMLYSHSNLDDAFLEDDAVESTPVPEPQQISPANDPKVGDFVSVKYTLGKKQLIYNAVVSFSFSLCFFFFKSKRFSLR